MNFLVLLAETAKQSNEGWLLTAVGIMIVFNIVWKPIERKLFPNDALEQLTVAVSALAVVVRDIQVKNDELHKWHDDVDDKGIQRWKVTLMQDEVKKQTECLNRIETSTVKQELLMEGQREDTKAMTKALQQLSNTMTGRYKQHKQD